MLITPVSELSGLAAQTWVMFAMPFDRRVWLAAAMLLVAPTGHAKGDDISHQDARRLVQEGRILPLAEILAHVGHKVPGDVLDVELELEDGAYVYELEILKPDGKVQEVEVDAPSGKIIEIEDDD
ncbi:MAG TPA: PepSY domain-containing protein [Methyloceanibacter sp.]|nr:PepSY domain-containing protein [Methyloceanibacter sp.]